MKSRRPRRRIDRALFDALDRERADNGLPHWYFDRRGKAISMYDWATRFDLDRHVAETTLGNCWVSTVYVGVDMTYDLAGRKPHIFETMVFHRKKKRGSTVLDGPVRYATLAQAARGHKRIVAKWRGKLGPVA